MLRLLRLPTQEQQFRGRVHVQELVQLLVQLLVPVDNLALNTNLLLYLAANVCENFQIGQQCIYLYIYNML